MKSGGQNPFADETEQSDQSEEQETEASTTGQSEEQENVVSNTGGTGQSDQTDGQKDAASNTGQAGQIDQEENPTPSGSNTRQFDRSDLPRIVVRDSVKEDRDGGVHQLFVYQDTEDNEKQARRELEDRFDDDLYKLDAREAIYLAGMQNLDDAEDILREWGMDF
ncbi:hypothetical protein [Natrinema sp. HArc-T2]|uniref:hypothetical protein n=1 Tax=Natrinema sp. HArc-T2 TaxID=3242701 RepID=UPI00359D11E0